MSAKRAATVSFADAFAQAQAELDRIREQVELIKIEIEETEQRPVDQDEVERRVDGAIAALAAHARRELPTGYFLNHPMDGDAGGTRASAHSPNSAKGLAASCDL
jgi:hypothetical protein